MVTKADAQAEKTAIDILAFQKYRMITQAIDQSISENSQQQILKSIIFSGIILVLLIVFIILVNKLYYFLDNKIHVGSHDWLSKIRIREYQLLTTRRQIILLHNLNAIFRYGMIVFLFILALFITSYLLPWTKGYSLIFLGFILKPIKDFLVSLWQFIPNLFAIIVIVFITRMVLRFFRFLKTEIEAGEIRIRGFFPEWASPVFDIVRFLAWAFTVIMLWPYLPGSDSKIFQGVSVFIGLLVSITSASILGNLMSGFSLTFIRAFKPGDRIRVGDVTGDVVEKTLAVTKVKTIKNEIVTIPNSKITSSEVINYSTLAPVDGLILHTTVTIGYDAPWGQVHQLLIEAAKETRLVLQEPEPFVLQTRLDDFYVAYQINAYTRDSNSVAIILSELHQNIQKTFFSAGVEIMSPHYSSLRDGNRVAMPDENLSPDYNPPEFGVHLKKD